MGSEVTNVFRQARLGHDTPTNTYSPDQEVPTQTPWEEFRLDVVLKALVLGG